MSRISNIAKAIDRLRLKKILPHLKSALNEEDNPYLKQYEFIARHFIKFRDKPTYEDYVIGSHIVYAWMLRVLKFEMHDDHGSRKKVQDILIKAQKENVFNVITLTNDELKKLALPFRGSLVAPSKFLHFLNPDAWPIWDSRVYRGISKLNGKGTSAYHYEMQNVYTYVAYVNKLRSLAKSSDKFGENSKIIELKTATNIRCLELGLFMAGKSDKQ